MLRRNTTVLGIGSLLPVYLVSRLGASEFLMDVLLAVDPAAQMVFTYLLGPAADRVDRSRSSSAAWPGVASTDS